MLESKFVPECSVVQFKDSCFCILIHQVIVHGSASLRYDIVCHVELQKYNPFSGETAGSTSTRFLTCPDHDIEITFDAFENRQYRDSDALYTYLKEQIKDDAMYYVLLHEVTLCRQPPLNHPSNDKPCPLPYNDYRIKRGDECCFSLCLQGKSLNYRRKKS